MDDQKQNTNNSSVQTPQMQNASTVPPVMPLVTDQPASMVNTVPPVASSDGIPPVTDTTASPVTSPAGEKKSNKGLLVVALILIALIAVLAVLYFVIIKQSSAPAAVVPVQKQIVVKPTVPPVIPTVTPTDNQLLNTPPEDPSTDAAGLNQVTQGL